MLDNKNINGNEAKIKDALTFEIVSKEENIVKAVSYNEDGKKQEVFFYAIPEKEFEALIPTSSNGSNNGTSINVSVE